MSSSMGPPPPRNPNNTIKPPSDTLDSFVPMKSLPAPLNPIPVSLETQIHTQPTENDQSTTENISDDNAKEEHRPIVAVPYTMPPWSEPPCHPYFLEVLKDGSILHQFQVHDKGAYMFGRVDLCDFVLDHPTISRFHAVLQFKRNGDAYLYDLSSTHGTFINKNQVKKKVYVDLHVGDVIRFGHSSRLYIFQGPSELMLPEKDLKNIRSSKIREEMRDMEASLRRAKLEASLADGVTWGMDEDAIEENEDDIEEITWQTYKGQLTEKQEKTRDKVIKRLEKIANMKKEIDAIRAKDISQGGLTQGQQTQIARNEQRMSQIVEELENLEETLNESIRESLGARTGRICRGKKKGPTEEDEDEYVSDDDEFYDRAKKKPPKQKGAENQSIETADSLLDKKDAIIKEMEDKRKLIVDEKNKLVPENEVVADAGDALDAYMTNLSSQLVVDKTEQLEKELHTLQSELDRVLYLLKIADPTGEAVRKRESREQELKLNTSKKPSTAVFKQPPLKQNNKRAEEKTSSPIQKQGTDDATMKSSEKPVEESEIVADAKDSKTTVYSVVKPQWLGAVEKIETKQTQQDAPLDTEENDDFVDYKDRKKALVGNVDTAQVNVDSGLENAAPGLIIRKRKQVEKSDSEVKGSEEVAVSSAAPEIEAEDAVALLLKHTRGYHAPDDEVRKESDDMALRNQSGKGKKRPKKVLGPQKPPFLDSEPDYEAWVPPAGQSGDGRTSLNDRLGY